MQAIRLLIVVVGMVVGAKFAAAQDYPTRPVMIIQPTAAGGPSDILIRVIADALAERAIDCRADQSGRANHEP